MQRVVPAQAILLGCEEPVGLDHDQWVAGFHAEQEVVVVQVAANLCELKSRRHHAPAYSSSRFTRGLQLPLRRV